MSEPLHILQAYADMELERIRGMAIGWTVTLWFTNDALDGYHSICFGIYDTHAEAMKVVRDESGALAETEREHSVFGFELDDVTAEPIYPPIELPG